MPNAPDFLIGRYDNVVITAGMPLSALRNRSESQNKKYLCAIGNTSAGAQVRSSPSALTS